MLVSAIKQHESVISIHMSPPSTKSSLTKALSPYGAVIKNLPADERGARDVGLIPTWGRSPGGGNGNPLQCSHLASSMDRGTWWATVHGIAESRA